MKKISREDILNFYIVISIAVFLTVFGLVLFGSGGTEDLATFHKWLTILIDNPLAEAYSQTVSDYPPLFIFSFYPVAFLDPIIGLWAVIHLSILLNLLLSTALFYLLTRHAGMALVFYFAAFFGAMILKYTDVNFTPAFLLSLWALSQRRFLLFAVFYSVACLIKWQPLILAPFFLVYIVHHSWQSPQHRLKPGIDNPLYAAMGGMLLVLSGTIAFFGFDSVMRAFLSVANEPWLSGYALNLHWITTYYLHVTQPQQYGSLVNGISNYITPGASIITQAKIPFIVFYSLTLLAFHCSEKNFENLLKFSMAGFFTYFMLNTGVHENHLYIAIVLGLLLAAHAKKYHLLAGFMIIAFNLNLFVFQGFGRWQLTTQRFMWVDISLPLSILLFLFWCIYWFVEIAPHLKKRVA